MHCIKWVRVVVFNATFNNISAISWRSVLLSMESCQAASIRPGLKSIEPIAPNLMPRLLSTVQVHTTHCWPRCHNTFSLLSKLFLLKSVFSANQISVFRYLRIFSDLSKFSSFMAPWVTGESHQPVASCIMCVQLYFLYIWR